MYTLYYSPGTCSMAVHVLLNELNAPFTSEKVSINPKSENLLKVNPRGQVPVLTLDTGENIREGGAILTYLCDTHGAFLPKSGAARAKALEWLMFCNASLHPAYGAFFMLKGMNMTDSPIAPAVMANINAKWADIEAHLATSKYLCGDEVTVADFLLTVIANWNGYLAEPIKFGFNTQRFLKDISSRPAYQKALAAEEIQYKAVA